MKTISGKKIFNIVMAFVFVVIVIIVVIWIISTTNSVFDRYDQIRGIVG